MAEKNNSEPRALTAEQLIVDLTSLIDILIDLPPRALQGMLTEQPEFPFVAEEIRRNQGQWGERAGITESDFDTFVSASDKIERIDKVLPRVLKIKEVLLESRSFHENERQHVVLTVAESVDRRSRKHPELLALYDQTRKYRSAPGVKAARTRRRNEAGIGKGTPPESLPPTPPSANS